MMIEKMNGSSKIRAIGFHHNIIPIPRTKHDSELQDAGDVLALIVDSKLNLVLTGAKNTSGCWQIEDTVFVNAGTFSSQRYNNRLGNSFNVIQVYKTDFNNVMYPCLFDIVFEIFAV